jgi:hypothetical protein
VAEPRETSETETSAPALKALESWFQHQIVSPHETRSKSFDDRNQTAAPHVRPSATLQPAERVQIYSSMYFARLHDVLAEEYPSTRALCGPVEFERLARAYLREHPSRHWSLNGLGRKLPAFLAGPFRIPRKALLADVARLECAMSTVFDANESPVLKTTDMARIPGDAFPSARVKLIDALELHAFDHRANAIVRALRQDEKPPALTRHPTRTVVWRKEWTVWRMDLDEPLFAVLSALKAGERVQSAIEAGAARFDGEPLALPPRIFAAFGEWISEGLLSSIEIE